MTTWNLTILDGRTSSATVMSLVEYGDGSIRRERNGRYTVLKTSWEWMSDHLYFVARPYVYARGTLTPAKSRGMWQRRFLFSFERERGRGCTHDRNGAGGCPGQWLERATHVPWSEPKELP